MTTIDITCDCDAKHTTYSVTDSHGVTQLVSFCAECAHGAAADWDIDGAFVKIVRPDRDASPLHRADFDPMKDSVLIGCPLCTVSNGMHESGCPGAVSA